MLMAFAVVVLPSFSQQGLDCEVSFSAGYGSGDFAPYYISSLKHGRFSSSKNLQAEISVSRAMNKGDRFSYGYSADVIAGYASGVGYERYDKDTEGWVCHTERPSSVWIQQLYGEVKYRGVFASFGMKEHTSALLNQRLTSGDLVESGNCRPIPQLRVGFVDFQDIPFTNGWMQIQGEVSYGKRLDNGWWRDHYNYYNDYLPRNEWYNYKRCYFRTRPSEPFCVTFGMQAAGEFGGISDYYSKGVLVRTDNKPIKLHTFFQMLMPTEDGGEGFYSGNHLGAWDFRARYRFKGGHEVAGYFSWPFEDGSGIAKQNGWDGLWGLEYKAPNKGVISGALIEYLDLTNHGGPITHNPADYPGTSITSHVSGQDNYYNHGLYASYAYFGMSIGTPAMMSPIYNRDGYIKFVGNVMRAFHVGIEGDMTSSVSYRLKGGYRKAYGNSSIPFVKPIHLASFLAQINWRSKSVKGLSVNTQLGLDRGDMPCNSFGAMVSVKYNGLLNF